MNTLDKTRSILALVTISLAALAGCGADSDGSGSASLGGRDHAAPERHDEPSSDDSLSSSPSPQGPTADAGPVTPSNPPTDDAGPTNDAGPTTPRTMPLHCVHASADTSPLFCLETAEGKAGDVVELEVHVLGTPACSDANQLYGRVRFDPTYFELVNVASHVDCTSRDTIPDGSNPGMELITWQKFGGGAILGCDDEIQVGKVDTIKIRIKPGTPPGDYSFGWDASEFWGSDQACDTMDNHIGSEIRVVP